jgi:hypothetical protein
MDAHEGIIGPYPVLERFPVDEAVQAVAKMGGAGFVDAPHMVERSVRIVELGGGDKSGFIVHGEPVLSGRPERAGLDATG